MTSQTFVQELVAEGRDKFDRCLPSIEEVFSSSETRNALRLVILGIASEEARSWNWSSLQKDLELLFAFPKGANPEFHNNTVRRFGLALTEQRQRHLHAYLALLACHLLELAPNLRERGLVEQGLKLLDFVPMIERYVASRNHLELRFERNSSMTLRGVYGVIRKALGTDKTDIRLISRHFFMHPDPDASRDLEFNDQSFYVCYRYSESSGQIVKSFLVINSPAYSDNDAFTFVHIHKTKSGRGEVKRISRGALIGFDDAFYFLGGSARSLKGTMDKAMGFKMMSLPVDSFVIDQTLLAGMFLSTSLQWKPVVGKIALVHLGFRTSLGKGMTDESIDLKLLGKDQLAGDIRQLWSGQSKTESEITTAADFVIRQINNRPNKYTAGQDEIFGSLLTGDFDHG